MTVTRWTLSPASVLRKTARVAVSVLPSPVFISAIAPVVQDHAADQLHVVVALADRAPRRLAGQGKGLGQQIVERLAARGALAQLVGLLAQLLIVEQLHLRLDRVDRLGALLVTLEFAPLADAQRARDHVPGVRHAQG